MIDFFKFTDKSNQIGNVELTLVNDFKKDGDMIFWKTTTGSRGFMFAKSVIGGCVDFKTVIIHHASGTQHIECGSVEIADEVLNCIIGICTTLHTSGYIGAVKMSAIEAKFENVVEPCKCDGDCDNCVKEQADETNKFDEFMQVTLRCLKEIEKEFNDKEKK